MGTRFNATYCTCTVLNAYVGLVAVVMCMRDVFFLVLGVTHTCLVSVTYACLYVKARKRTIRLTATI